jgi:hypothetical protein
VNNFSDTLGVKNKLEKMLIVNLTSPTCTAQRNQLKIYSHGQIMFLPNNAGTETVKHDYSWWKCDSLPLRFTSLKVTITDCYWCIEAAGSAAAA